MKKIVLLLSLFFSILVFTEPLRKLSVTGNAEREIMPDIAKISFKVYTKNSDVKKASKENETNLSNFKNELKKRGIVISNMETSKLYSQRLVEGENKTVDKKYYTSVLSFSIRVDDLTKMPDLIDLAQKNNVTNVRSDNRDRTLYYAEIKRNNNQKNGAITDTLKVYDTIRSQLAKVGISKDKLTINSYSNTLYEQKEQTTGKEIVTYAVYNDFVIELSDISKINDVLQIAENNKIVNNGYINFDISNREEIESELYSEAYEQTKVKAASILKSSNLILGEPLVISESISYQNEAIRTMNSKGTGDARMNGGYAYDEAVPPTSAPLAIDFKPQILKLTQNISVMYEIK